MVEQEKTLPATIDDGDVHLIARHPAEMERCQSQLVDWATRREALAQKNFDECIANRDIARDNGWQVEPWQRRVRIAKRTLRYYRKLRMALEAGYYIIPPMPFQAFAIRTSKRAPKRKDGAHPWHNFDQTPESLPAGEGRYVSAVPALMAENIYKKFETGETVKTGEHWWADAFRNVDFPFKLVKPEIMDATAKAMALEVFDQIGVLPQARAADPMIAGQIIGPKRTVTFFIGWWLDTKDL